MSAARWRNLTDHAITIVSDGQRAVIAPDGAVARTETNHPIIGYTAVSNVVVPVMTVRTTRVSGLPPYREDANLIVSSHVARAVPHRPDVYCPGPLIRAENGAIEGTRGLIMAAAFAGTPRPMG
jgi:hypothetical protein